MKNKDTSKIHPVTDLARVHGRVSPVEKTGAFFKYPDDKFESFFNLSNEMLCIADLAGYIKTANPVLKKTLGYPDEELYSSTLYKFVHPDDNCDTFAKVQEILSGAGDSRIENRCLCKDGSVKWIGWNIYADKVQGLMYGVAHDITERKLEEEELKKSHDMLEKKVREYMLELEKANSDLKNEIVERKKVEQALRESEELYRIRFEESPISLWDKDYSGIREYTEQLKKEKGITDFKKYFSENRAALEHCASLIKVTDVNETTVKNYRAKDKPDFMNNIYKIFCEETWDCFMQECIYVAEGKGKREGEAVTLKFDGEPNNIMVRWQIPRQYEGSYKRILFSIIDITENKRMEQAARLIQAKLIHANKMTSLGTLVSGVAHEINNPNSYIMSNACLFNGIWKDAFRLLSEKYRKDGDFLMGEIPFSELGSVAPKLLDGITEGASRIKNIVDNLRSFARPESVKKDERVDVNNIVRNAATILEPQIKKCTDHFKMFCSDGMPVVKGSSQQLEQVVINLIMNSLQALPNKARGINVSTSYDKKQRYVTVEVKDEGSGIPEDILERITEPFFTTKLDSGGTGLGLSISYGIIKELKGSLEFKSKPGRGTTVFMKLPAYGGEA
ncbi:MAG: PAS domain S-box protein [Nitrospirae bacterium]|nr:PAS domain S-box protein [Nitrospirota bacterium]